jgi:hypothetical protein
VGIAEKFNNAKKGLKSRDGVKGGFDEGWKMWQRIKEISREREMERKIMFEGNKSRWN